MAYIGRGTETISNVEVLDNLTFDGSASYTLQKSSVNFVPSSANNLLISISGVVQQGNFSVSGSTITFDTTVSGSDTCDWILHYGTGLITTVADGAITETKLGSNAVTNAKITDGTIANAKLVNSSITLNGSAVSLGGSASVDNTPSFFAYLSTQQNGIAQTSYTLATLQSTLWDTDSAYNTGTYTYTIPSGKGGKYCFFYGGLFGNLADGNFCEFILYVNGSGKKSSRVRQTMGTAQSSIFRNSCILNVSAGDTVQLYVYHNNGSTQSLYVEDEITCLGGFKLIGV